MELALFPYHDLPMGLLRLFADDTLYSSTGHQQLQADLTRLEQWATRSDMEINLLKSDHVTLTRRRDPIDTRLALYNSAEYLRVTMRSKLKWNVHVNFITSKTNSVLEFEKRISSKAQKFRTTGYSTLFWSIHLQLGALLLL